MGVIMSPQRGAIAALISGERTIILDHCREFLLEGAQEEVFELGVNRDPTRRGANPADVLVVGYDRPQESAQNGFRQGYVVLLRDATEEEKRGWTATRVETVELLEPVTLEGRAVLLRRTGKKESYAWV